MSMSSEALAAYAPTKVGSSATDLIINLKLASLVGVGLSTTTVSGSAPPSYNPTGFTLASVNQTLNLGAATGGLLNQGVKTGLITATAKGALPTSTATATVNNLGLDLRLIVLTLVGINATVISSTTAFDGQNLIGDSNIVGLNLSTILPGLALGAAVNGNPAANTNISPLATRALGLNIIENEQIFSSSISAATPANPHGIETGMLTTSALHVSYKDFLVRGALLTGDIYIAQSSASFTRPAPETATWMMLIVGFGAIGMTLRSRNRANLSEDEEGLARVALAA
jgi:hypothetical protein